MSRQRQLNPAFKNAIRSSDVVFGNSSKSEDALFKGARYSGKLDLSNRGLTEVPSSVFALDDSMEADEKWWMVVETREINLNDNKLARLPEELARLEQLEQLSAARNNVTVFQALCLDFPLLKQLDLSQNKLKMVDSPCLHSNSLVVLKLSGNALRTIPPLNLPMLEVLELSGNQLTALPEFSETPRLKRLAASENALESPPDLNPLPLLEYVDLRKNALRSFPTGLSSLSRLLSLNLGYNKLKVGGALPPQLTDVILGFNQLIHLDDLQLGASGARSALSVLDVRDNKIERLPAGLFACVRLKFLELSNNNLRELPAGLGYLPDLQQLAVEGNLLRSVRRTLLTGSTLNLKKYLRTRGPAPSGLAELAASSTSKGDSVATAGERGTQTANVVAAQANTLQREAFVHAVREAQTTGILNLCTKPAVSSRGNMSRGGLSRERGDRADADCWSEVVLAELLEATREAAPLYELPSLEIRLRRNRLLCIGSELSRALAAMRNLRVVDFAENQLRALPAAIGTLPCLEELVVRGNKLDDEGLLELARAFENLEASPSMRLLAGSIHHI